MRLVRVSKELQSALRANQAAFGMNLSDAVIEDLGRYYCLVREHDPLLHLVAPCPVEEFAIRHILESLMLTEKLPKGAVFADVGTGAGLPSIPCLIARDDLSSILIESKQKKAIFLQKALEELGLAERAEVEDRQFQETTPGRAGFVTTRALDRLTERLPRLVRWADGRTLLLFGGSSLGETLEKLVPDIDKQLLPLSNARFLYKVDARANGSRNPSGHVVHHRGRSDIRRTR